MEANAQNTGQSSRRAVTRNLPLPDRQLTDVEYADSDSGLGVDEDSLGPDRQVGQRVMKKAREMTMYQNGNPTAPLLLRSSHARTRYTLHPMKFYMARKMTQTQTNFPWEKPISFL